LPAVTDESGSRGPYGPATPTIRRFLVQLAGLGASGRSAALARFDAHVDAPAWLKAERILGDTIERAGRAEARDTLAGPLLQLVRRAPTDQAATDSAVDEADPLAGLDPIAEPALAALMALLVRDLLPADVFATLYHPFADEIPLTA
jgi:hypothetical protein